jgi:hypothetical protein
MHLGMQANFSDRPVGMLLHRLLGGRNAPATGGVPLPSYISTFLVEERGFSREKANLDLFITYLINISCYETIMTHKQTPHIFMQTPHILFMQELRRLVSAPALRKRCKPSTEL